MLRLLAGFVICFVVALAPMRPAMAGVDALRITMTVKTNTQAKDEKPVDKTATVIATLQKDGFTLREGDTETVYAVAARRILRIDHAKRSVVDESLYAVPAFRDSELKNRLGMAALVEKTNGKNHDYRFLYRGELEHSYGLTARGDSGVVLTKRQSGASLVYDAQELGAFENGNWKVPPALADSYRHFLIYAYVMHPRLRAAMLSAPRGFGRLTLSHRPMDKKRVTTTITVDGATAVQPGKLDAPADYAVIYIDSKKLQPPIAAVHAGDGARTSATYTAQIDAALSRGRYSEAMLAAFEHMVQFGKFPEGAVERITAAAPEKDWSRSLVQLIANPPGEGGDIAAYMNSLQTVADYISAPNKYELNVHLADLYLRQGDAQRAFELLSAALAQNPYLTGAYMTLGDVFFHQFDMQSAMACWEAALAAAPQSNLVARAAAMRDDLEQTHPEFF